MWPIFATSFAVAATILVAWYAFQRLKARGRKRVEVEVLRGRPPRRMDDMANFFGLQSIGAVQLRGNGCLALSDDELVFAQWVTEKLLRIPLTEILEVSEAKGHLGKWIGRPLLSVRFRVDGGEDTVVWFVHDLPGWRAALDLVVPRAAVR